VTTPQFFVPAANDLDHAERLYADFAKWCGVAVPPLRSRVYSITFVHDGEEWTATVGESLQGVKLKRPRLRSLPIQRGALCSDPARVLAIFRGTPWFVVTDHGLAGFVGSKWENPFLVGQPNNVEPFQMA
jgi:hypothetical protein